MGVKSNYAHYDDTLIGEVLDIDVNAREVAVYIPKLMVALPAGNKYSSQISTTSNRNISGAVIEDKVTVRNSIWLKAVNIDEAIPKVGSKVFIYTYDEDPKNMYWAGFKFDRTFEVIDEEKYKSLYSLQVNSSSINIFEEDNIQLSFSDYDVTSVEDGKNKSINMLKKESYVVSMDEPESKFTGLLWFDARNALLKLYKDNKFNVVLLDKDLDDVYRILEESNDRILFVSATRNILSPVNNQIVGINPFREGSGFYTYKTVASSVDWTNTEKTNGIYYLSYVNKVKEVIGDSQAKLIAYKYDETGLKWNNLDGWVDWTQPVDLGEFDDGNIVIAAPSTITFTNTEDVRVNEIKFVGISLTTDTDATFTFTTTDSEKIGATFTLTNTAGVYTMTPSYYESAYYNSGTGTLLVPDIPTSGVVIGDLVCDITSTTGTTLNFGATTITAKIEGVE